MSLVTTFTSWPLPIWMHLIIGLVVFCLIAPVVGMLLFGIDRIISARMQRRQGPPLLQPLYDVRKLIEKDRVTVNGYQDFYVLMYFICIVVAGVCFFSGLDLLLSVFVFTVGSMFLVIAAACSNSPYASAGAAREIIQVASYEPAVLLVPVALYMSTGGFKLWALPLAERPMIVSAPFIFFAFLFVLTIKLRKSPFDLSMSHHAHTDLVAGVTTEFSGKTLALIEISHWMEAFLFTSWISLFFISAHPLSILFAIAAFVLAYFLEIWIDNCFARVRWQFMLKSAWLVTLICAIITLVAAKF